MLLERVKVPSALTIPRPYLRFYDRTIDKRGNVACGRRGCRVGTRERDNKQPRRLTVNRLKIAANRAKCTARLRENY